MNLAPIVFFVYNRPRHTRIVVEALQRNELADRSDFFVYSDGPKTAAERDAVNEVRSFIRTITGFRSVTLIERDSNIGCADSIVRGVSELINRFGQVIVVEDDILTSPYFLKFMNEGLDFYRDIEIVACIHGYVYPVDVRLPESFFIRGTDNWGWATWKRGWELYEPDCEKLLNELCARDLTHAFDFDGSYHYTQVLKDQIDGKLDAWDIRWYAAAFLQEKLTLYPGRSLVQNIGIDGSGTHCGESADFDTIISREPVRIQRIPLEENKAAREAFKKYFQPPEPSLARTAFEQLVRLVKKMRSEK